MSDGLLTTYWQDDLTRCSELLIGQSIAGLEIRRGCAVVGGNG